MSSENTESEWLPPPQIPPKRQGHSRNSSSVASINSEHSRHSFPISQYRQSAIIEMGQALPMEINNIPDAQEVHIQQQLNRNSVNSIASTLPLPLQEPLQHPSMPQVPKIRPQSYRSATDKSFENLQETVPLRPPKVTQAKPRSTSISEAFISAQESIEDLHDPPHTNPLNPLNGEEDDDSIYAPLKRPEDEEKAEKRRSQTLKKLQEIIADDEEDDASYVTASGTPRLRRSALKYPTDKKEEHSSLRISNPDLTAEYHSDYPVRSSSRRRGYDTVAPRVALQAESAEFVENKPKSEKHRQSKRKRNFTKKSLEDMMGSKSQVDIHDIGLPKPERVLIEKFIDSLSRLSIEVQMDEGKRAEGRRRMNNALRALDGWF